MEPLDQIGDLTYKVIVNGSNIGNNIIIDSNGYSYTKKMW